MSLVAGLLWYFVVFESDGGLVTTPMPFESDEQCQTAMAEFQAKYPATGWDTQCISPDE